MKINDLKKTLYFISDKNSSAKDMKRRIYYSLTIWAICTIVCLSLSSYIRTFIEWPYNHTMDIKASFVSVGPITEFLSYLKMGVVVGFVVSSPWIFYWLWRYIFASLYPGKEILTRFWVIFASVSFIVGAFLFHFAFLPFYFGDMVAIEQDIFVGSPPLTVSMMFEGYISFVTTGMLISGLLFHSPMIWIFLKSLRKRNIVVSVSKNGI